MREGMFFLHKISRAECFQKVPTSWQLQPLVPVNDNDQDMG